MEIIPTRQFLVGLALKEIERFFFTGPDIIPGDKPIRLVIRLLHNIALQGLDRKIVKTCPDTFSGERLTACLAFVAQACPPWWVDIEIPRLIRHCFLIQSFMLPAYAILLGRFANPSKKGDCSLWLTPSLKSEKLRDIKKPGTRLASVFFKFKIHKIVFHLFAFDELRYQAL